MSKYFCRICERTLEIPEGSVEVGIGRLYQLFRFPDGQLHDLKRVALKRSVDHPNAVDESHNPPPTPATELLESVKAILTELPTPIPERPPETAMSIAFRNFKNN
jgi:hypothetical protein